MARSLTSRSTNPKIMDDNIKILDEAVQDAATPEADEVAYDNTDSGLTADDVQGAIDEVAPALTAEGTKYSTGVSVKSKIDNLIKYATFTGTTNASGLLSMEDFKQIISAKSNVVNHCIILFDYYSTSNYTVFKVLNGADMTPVANTAITIDYYYI